MKPTRPSRRPDDEFLDRSRQGVWGGGRAAEREWCKFGSLCGRYHARGVCRHVVVWTNSASW